MFTADAIDIAEHIESFQGPDFPSPRSREELLHQLRRYYLFRRDVRQGICLLNAGQFDKAAARFAQAAEQGFRHPSLSAWLGACFMGRGEPEKAAAKFGEPASGTVRTANQIRQAYALRAAGRLDAAVEHLRDAARQNPESAELQFQLGLLLAETGRHDEAELRFSHAVSLQPGHTEALVSLGLCCGVRKAPAAAAKHLQAAQHQRPWDARIGLLLTQAVRAARDLGHAVRGRAIMPESEAEEDRRGIERLSRVIEADPDFVDAFLSLPAEQMDPEAYITLLRTLESALERQPEQAELLFHCGRVLERLGRRDDAIDANEQAVRLNPRFVRALIELAELYRKTDRTADAATRLEQAVAAGADYADVYFRLGDLYRDQGQLPRARAAYERALTINSRYTAAREALAALPA